MPDVNITIRTIDETNTQNKRIIGGFTELNSAINLMRQGLEKAKQAYNFAREGAQLDMLQTRFDRLSESIGTTSEALLTDLKEATRGMYDDFELMKNAADFVGLGLAKDHDEAVRLARVSAGLNMNMNQLVLTLTNMTTMRFDALGVRVDGFKDRLKDLEGQGYDTNDAFKEAFLQQAEEQLERVGEAADTNIGAFMRLEAQWKNVTNSFKQQAGDALAPVATAFADSMEEAERYRNTLQQLNIDLYNQYRATGRITPEMRALVETYNEWTVFVDENTASWDKHLRILGQGSEVLQEIADNTEEVTKANQKWLDIIGEFSDDYKDKTDAINKINEERAEIEAKMNADLALGWWENSERILGYKEKLDDLDKKEQEYTENYTLNSSQRKLAAIEEELAKDGLTENEMRRLEELGLAWGVYTTEGITQARNFRNEVAEIVNAINGIPTERTVTIRADVQGDFTSLGAGSGIAGHRQHGGPVFGANAYEVTEKGMPEMLLMGNRQFLMMPPGSSGNVSPVQSTNGGQSSEMMSALYTLMINLPDDLARAWTARSQKVGRNA